MKDIKLPYALKDGELVHISEVERGLSCSCICPNCKGQLIARKGEYKSDHFAHYSTGECQGALETTLHLVAKKILEKCHYITLPAVKVDLGFDFPVETIINLFPFDENDPEHEDEEGSFFKYWGNKEWEHLHEADEFHNYDVDYFCRGLCIEQKLLSRQKAYKVDNAVLESSISNIIPDIILDIQNTLLLIEIYVTHKIDYSKLQKIKELDLSVVEIDLSDWDGNLHYDTLEKIIVGPSKHKRWVYNRKVDMYQKRLFHAVEIKKTIFKTSKRNNQILVVVNL